MAATVHTLDAALGIDFALACTELADARAKVRSKDTPAHRAAVSGLLSRIDGLLDMFLESGGLQPWAPAA